MATPHVRTPFPTAIGGAAFGALDSQLGGCVRLARIVRIRRSYAAVHDGRDALPPRSDWLLGGRALLRERSASRGRV